MSTGSLPPKYTGATGSGRTGRRSCPRAPKLFAVARWVFPFAWGGLVVGMGGPPAPALLGVFGLLLLEAVLRGPPGRC